MFALPGLLYQRPDGDSAAKTARYHNIDGEFAALLAREGVQATIFALSARGPGVDLTGVVGGGYPA